LIIVVLELNVNQESCIFFLQMIALKFGLKMIV